MGVQPLLVELFVEELPPKSLKQLGEAFAATLADGLRAEGLAEPGGAVTPFASPRRLAARVDAVGERAADRSVAHKLMPVAVGLTPGGQATPALSKKLAALGAPAAAVDRLERRVEGKAETLYLTTDVPGASLQEGLQRALAAALARLPIPKVMRYQLADGWSSVDFVRPAHGLVALHGDAVVPVGALGLTAGRETHGHRFEASVDPIVLRDARSYEAQLRDEGAVIASFEARRDDIAAQLRAAASVQDLDPIEDPALLDEVTALVERPNVLRCRFEPEFLEVPSEVLILTMKANQKYFPLLRADGRLTHEFLVVSNIRPSDPSRVIEGNERVVRPRLADAKFFFDQDRRKTLESRLPGLEQVVYHARLGSQAERARRVRTLAESIASQLVAATRGAQSTPALDLGPALVQRAGRAAALAKADLLTDMVGEFPELQGTMGAYYARHDGEPEDVAEAIEDHYRPRFAGDALPRSATGLSVALADKLETLVGLFGIGQVPTGDKDPFALRRHALGVIRMLVERSLPLELERLLASAFEAFVADAASDTPGASPRPRLELQAGVGEAVSGFIYERFAGLLREQGYASQDIEAVLALKPARLSDVAMRLAAVRAFATLPESEALAAANKRVGNILRKAGAPVAATVTASLLTDPAERALSSALDEVRPAADAAFERGDYAAALRAWAALRAPVDAFFDRVMVNAEDPALRANRLGLLAQLHAAMNRVADLSRLAA